MVSKRDENICNFLEGGLLIGGSDNKREAQLAGRIYGTTSSIVRTNYGDAAQGVMFGGASNTSWSGSGNVVLADKTTLQNMPEYKAIVAEVNEHLTGVSTDFVGYQTTAAGSDGKFDMRLVATISGNFMSYGSVGFDAGVRYTKTDGTVVEKDAIFTSNVLYESILGTDGAGTETQKKISAESLGGDYIFVLVCKNLPSDATDVQFTVTTFYKGVNGAVRSEEREFTVICPGDTVLA